MTGLQLDGVYFGCDRVQGGCGSEGLFPLGVDRALTTGAGRLVVCGMRKGGGLQSGRVVDACACARTGNGCCSAVAMPWQMFIWHSRLLRMPAGQGSCTSEGLCWLAGNVNLAHSRLRVGGMGGVSFSSTNSEGLAVGQLCHVVTTLTVLTVLWLLVAFVLSHTVYTPGFVWAGHKVQLGGLVRWGTTALLTVWKQLLFPH